MGRRARSSMPRLPLILLLLLAGCAHHEVSLNAGASSASGTRVVSSDAGLQVNAGGSGVAAALIAAGVVAATVHDLRDPQPMPRYRSLAEWFAGPAAPEMDPSRSVSEQDCSRPIASAGNLRCR
jgi:hypothetical protein